MPRRAYNDPGHAHFLTFSCYHRHQFLTDDRVRMWLTDSIGIARTRNDFTLWAYVIMPDHVHVLIHPRWEEYSISKILRDIKEPVSHRVVRQVRETAAWKLKLMKARQGSARFIASGRQAAGLIAISQTGTESARRLHILNRTRFVVATSKSPRNGSGRALGLGLVAQMFHCAWTPLEKGLKSAKVSYASPDRGVRATSAQRAAILWDILFTHRSFTPARGPKQQHTTRTAPRHRSRLRLLP
jgi:REP element-mobilizing transposase RayT